MAYTRAKVVEEISATADRVFGEIGAFNNLPVIMAGTITRSTLDRKGVVRTLRIKGMKGSLDETLLKFDTAARVQIYTITADPNDLAPFNDYTATIKVKPITSRRSWGRMDQPLRAEEGQDQGGMHRVRRRHLPPRNPGHQGRARGQEIAHTEAYRSRAGQRRGGG